MILRTMGLIAALFFAGNQIGFSQIKPRTLRASLYNEALSLPSIKLFHKPIHPALTVGADFWVKSRKHWQQAAGSDFTFYHHRLSENAFILNGTYTLGYKFEFGLQVKLLTGLGYKHSFLSGEVYKKKNGEYEKATNWGTAHANAKLGLGLEFPINKTLSITTDYNVMIVVPYSDSLPFSPHTFLGVGVKMNLAEGKSASAQQQDNTVPIK